MLSRSPDGADTWEALVAAAQATAPASRRSRGEPVAAGPYVSDLDDQRGLNQLAHDIAAWYGWQSDGMTNADLAALESRAPRYVLRTAYDYAYLSGYMYGKLMPRLPVAGISHRAKGAAVRKAAVEFEKHVTAEQALTVPPTAMRQAAGRAYSEGVTSEVLNLLRRRAYEFFTGVYRSMAGDADLKAFVARAEREVLRGGSTAPAVLCKPLERRVDEHPLGDGKKARGPGVVGLWRLAHDRTAMFDADGLTPYVDVVADVLVRRERSPSAAGLLVLTPQERMTCAAVAEEAVHSFKPNTLPCLWYGNVVWCEEVFFELYRMAVTTEGVFAAAWRRAEEAAAEAAMDEAEEDGSEVLSSQVIQKEMQPPRKRMYFPHWKELVKSSPCLSYETLLRHALTKEFDTTTYAAPGWQAFSRMEVEQQWRNVYGTLPDGVEFARFALWFERRARALGRVRETETPPTKRLPWQDEDCRLRIDELETWNETGRPPRAVGYNGRRLSCMTRLEE